MPDATVFFQVRVINQQEVVAFQEQLSVYAAQLSAIRDGDGRRHVPTVVLPNRLVMSRGEHRLIFGRR